MSELMKNHPSCLLGVNFQRLFSGAFWLLPSEAGREGERCHLVWKRFFPQPAQRENFFPSLLVFSFGRVSDELFPRP